MAFLHFLAEFRSPFLDTLFLWITELGGELFFTVVVLGTLWCGDGRKGFWIFFVWISGSMASQFLKVLCAVPRPWMADAAFAPVAKALSEAGGYSFPSGHSQSAAGLFGSAAVFTKKPWLRILFVFLAFLAGFSRMYLGVHTPLDVFVGLLVGFAPVLLVYWAFRRGNLGFPKLWVILLLLCAAGFLTYTLLAAPKSADQFFLEGAENAWKLAGATLGLALAWLYAEKHPFPVKARWFGQAGKLIFGAILALGIKEGLKAPLLLLFSGHSAAGGLRYFLLVLFAGLLWPLTFSFWARLGRK